jgi:hypothetical protein
VRVQDSYIQEGKTLGNGWLERIVKSYRAATRPNLSHIIVLTACFPVWYSFYVQPEQMVELGSAIMTGVIVDAVAYVLAFYFTGRQLAKGRQQET